MWCITTTETYASIKKNEIVIRIIIWMNLTDIMLSKRSQVQGFPGGAVVGSLPADAGDTGSSPGLGRSHMPRSD